MSFRVHDEQPSAFLRLPVETRLMIYSYLIPKDVLVVDICTPPRSAAQQFGSFPGPDASILVAQLFARESLIRHNGLQMLLVCRRTQDEVLPLLSNLTVRFHCTKCFEEFLSNMSHGLGVGVKWMRHLQVQYRCEDSDVPGPAAWVLTPDLSKFMVSEAMATLQRTAHIYYGRLDLTGREKWKYESVPDGSFLSGPQRRALLNWGDSQSGPNANIRTASVANTALHGHLPPSITGRNPFTGVLLRGASKVTREWVISAWLDTSSSVTPSHGLTGKG